jgi:hypothetical protein
MHELTALLLIPYWQCQQTLLLLLLPPLTGLLMGTTSLLLLCCLLLSVGGLLPCAGCSRRCSAALHWVSIVQVTATEGDQRWSTSVYATALGAPEMT